MKDKNTLSREERENLVASCVEAIDQDWFNYYALPFDKLSQDDEAYLRVCIHFYRTLIVKRAQLKSQVSETGKLTAVDKAAVEEIAAIEAELYINNWADYVEKTAEPLLQQIQANKAAQFGE